MSLMALQLAIVDGNPFQPCFQILFDGVHSTKQLFHTQTHKNLLLL